MVAVVEHMAQSTDSEKTIGVDFGERKAVLQLDPCLQYKIYLRLFSYNPNDYRTSEIVKYNDNATLNIASLYGGLLQDEQFMQSVCFKKEEVITFPDPPEAVSKCILTRGDQENDEFTAPGQSHFIPLQIVNPTNREPLTIVAMVIGIETCPPTATPTNTTDSIPKVGVTILTSTILATTLIIAVITTMVCCFKKKKRSEEGAPKVDTNEDYGLYYSTAGMYS